MRVITGGPLVGKTTWLIEIAARENLYIVCMGKREAERIASQANEMGYPHMPFPITFDEFIRGEFARGGTIEGFVIDNVDQMVRYMAREVPVKAISLRVDRPSLNMENSF